MFSLIQVAFPFETKKKEKKKTPLSLIVVADQFCVSSGCGFVTED
jgi:hypothetical protein